MREKARRLGMGRRFGCICLTAVMSVSLAAGNLLALARYRGKSADASDRYDTVSFENINGKMNLNSFALQNLSPNVDTATNTNAKPAAGEYTVIVTLDGKSVLETAPSSDSVSDYLNTYSGAKTLSAIERQQSAFLARLKNLGVNYTLKHSYTTVTNAVAIKVHTKYIQTIKGMDGVSSVVVSRKYNYPEAVTSDSIANVYKTGIYNSAESIEKYNVDGRGMTVAVLDTGLDYTHEAFSASIMDGVDESEYGMTKSFLNGEYSDGVSITNALNAVKSSAAKGSTITAEDLYVSAKVPFAYDYADSDGDVYPSYSQHGTHVAGIVGGQADSYTDKNGNVAVDENNRPISFQGVAPKSQLVICKVFTDDFDSKDLGGALAEDIIAALEDCAILGVDIINLSLGTAAGFSSLELEGDDEGIALARVYASLKAKGISVIAAASNEFSSGFGSVFGTNKASNPDSGTVGSPSTLDGSVSVASINGQLSDYLLANGTDRIFFNNSSGADGKRYDFVDDLLKNSDGTYKQSARYKYVCVSGTGDVANYSTRIQNELKDKTYDGSPVDGTIALVKRGSLSFQDKVQYAKNFGADAVIIYNNVSGTVSMSLGDIDNPVPSVSVDMDAGALLTQDSSGKSRSTGVIEVKKSYVAGPYMNDYSSWGSTPDLKLKPEVTAHGGEITSAVAGGYSEMSGTSMASPNLAGFVALLRSYIKNHAADYGVETNGKIDNVKLTRVLNQILMSTAETVYDQQNLPYSPRKQGAGLATLDNVFSTKAYLSTIEGKDNGAEDNRPKIELGEDEKKEGNYTLKFYVNNIGGEALKFKTQSIFMTETLASNGLSVAEKAYILDDNAAEWYVNGSKVAEGAEITVPANTLEYPVEVRLSLSAAEKRYIDNSFENGMFVEGFLKLVSSTDGQCDLTLPFMGFYGDWEAAPMLDYDCYQISEFEQDTSYTDETRPAASVWATQAYAAYYNEKYYIPMGGFSYIQDENASQKIYVDPEHAAISCFNEYYGEDNRNNYMSTTSIKALYAGLLRNAELVTYTLYDEYTGERIQTPNDTVYRVSKAYSNGGSSSPSFLKLDLSAEELGLVANGKYRLEFHFYQYAEDAENPDKQNDGNTFVMNFYVDYEAPVLVDTRIRYYDYKDGNKDKQRIYLDLDVFDNNYAQSVILCYSETQYNEDEEVDTTLLKMVTDYVVPVYNANKNGTTTVTIEITDIYDKFAGRLYVQLDDYALNSNVYALNFTNASDYSLPSSFDIVGGGNITIGVNEVYKVQLSYEGEASLSAFKWECRSGMGFVKVKNGEIFGVSPGTSKVAVVGPNGFTKVINVTVVDSNKTLDIPTLSFGVIEAHDSSLQKAQGTVKVRAGQTINLEVISEAWYYPVSSLNIRWTSSNTDIATVDRNGKVITQEKKGLATIQAVAVDENGREIASTRVILSVQEPFTVSNYVLTRYYGLGGELINGKRVLKLPDDQNIMTIGEDAFKDNDNVQVLIIPKTVTEISESAFENCKALEEVYFISQEAIVPADADLSTIRRYAFRGCNKLKKLDLSNCKTITLDRDVFTNCSALEEVVQMQKIGTMGDRTFRNTGLKEVNLGAIANSTITGLHSCGSSVFRDCTSLTTVTVDEFTAIGDEMFRGCASLTTVNGLNKVAQVGNSAFQDTPFHNGTSAVISGNKLILAPKNATSLPGGITEIGPYAFSGCAITSVNLTGVTKIGEGAFANSALAGDVTLPDLDIIQAYAFSGTKISQVSIPATVTTIGDGAFLGCPNLETVTFNGNNLTKLGNAVFNGTKLAQVVLPASVKEVGDMVFANCLSLEEATLTAVETLGSYTFLNCPKLETVVFGNGSKTTGDYTFFAGTVVSGNYTYDYENSLSSVTFGDGITRLGEGVFVGCDNLTLINLNKITEIGASAFESCANLATVEGLNKVTKIGAAAFANCTALPENLVLSSARVIGGNAFYNVGMASIEFPNAETIGAYAFFGNKLSTLTLPAGLSGIGDGAFAGASRLNSVAVASGNTKYFAEDGVLYRYITKETYELCIYPAARYAAAVDGVMTYIVKEGTVSVQGGSFSDLNSGSLQKVKFPYSVKVIGAFAFYNSGVGEYEFECINAPVLYVEPVSHRYTQYGYYTFFYTNFQNAFADYVNLNMYGAHPGTASSLKVSYPTNGLGYDNYIFSNYFGTKVLLGEMMDDVTREVKRLIESFAAAETVAGWNTSNTNYDDVYAFSENVKKAHRLLNTITSQTQLDFLGQDNVKKLSEIEKSLKPVKLMFGIQFTVVSLEVDPDCNYKSEYKEGEKFSMKGLVLIVTYDDYSTDYADMSQITLASGYEGGLSLLDRYVILQGYGKQVQVAITVTEGGAGGFKAVYVWAPIVGVVGAAGIAVGCFFLIKYLKKRKNAAGTPPVEETAASSEPAEEAKPEAEEVKPAKPKKKQTAKNSEKKD